MLLLSRPSEARVREFLSAQSELGFSYPELAASRGRPPRGYSVDHCRARLGSGTHEFAEARRAMASWRMFDLPWVDLCWPDTPIREGETVGVLIRAVGGWWLNACRVVYLIEDRGDVERFGFAYGTLEGHVERGEERFTVEWNRADDSVWYDLLAFSRPAALLARLGYPLVRRLQRRFRAGSLLAMQAAVATGGRPTYG